MTEEQQIESLRFSLESKKLQLTEKEMKIVRLNEIISDKNKIIEGYQMFIRDNLQNIIRREDNG
tara:strand:+ start:519 stop:710 length:192 start_codon:yes stop_codon:yes gene_type:complete